MALDQAQLDALEEGFRRGTVSAEDYAAAMGRAARDLTTSSSTFTNTFSAGSKSIYGGVENFTKSMANGAQGAASFGGVISGVASGAGKFSEMLSALGPLGKGVSAAFSGIADFGAEYVVRSLKQSDDLFTAFQGLSKVGGASEEGMKGVFDNMQKFGMTMNELPQFGAMITQNSEALAKLGGSVSQGTKTFANVAAGIQQSGLQAQFERMGLTIQAQNEGTASYLRLQTLTGASGKKSNEELTAGAAEYIRQQDRLSKLTGKSADTLAKEEEARMSDQRYRALTREMQQKADAAKAAGDIEGAKVIEAQMAANRELLANTPKELQKGVQDLMSGVVNSPEAQKMYTSMPQMAQTIMGQNFKASEVITAGAEEAKGALDRNTALAKAGLSNQVNADFAGLADLEAKNRVKTAAENDKAAKDEQDKLAAGKNVDINNQVAMREAQRSTTTAMDNLVNLGVSPLTEAMKTLATGINTGITTIPKELIGERTALKREPTADEKARGINPNRGETAPATAGYESKITVTGKDLTDAWDKFLKNVMVALEEEPNKDDKGKVKKKKVETVTPKPLAEGEIPPPPKPLGPSNELPSAVPPPPKALGSRGAGPAYQAPGVLEDNVPDNQPSTTSAAAGSTTELATVFSEGIKMITRGQNEQQQTLDELVELMRRSVGVQGKILQTSR